MNDEELGVKRDGTASDKRNGGNPCAPPSLPQTATPVDEPVAGKPQSTPSPEISTLMTEVLDKENLQRALERVRRNKGAPGIDGMTVDGLSAHLKAHWPTIRAQLVAGSYQPKPVKRVEIPKPDGRMRLLGIPTVTDRLIQQALAQVVQRQWEVHFHPHSYGFRPGRNAHQAIRHAQATIRQGYGWVVDIDLEAFFDRVNHDRLMVRVRQHVDAPDVLKLINRFLKGGVQVNGQKQATTEGVPQGGPLSPVLANVVLDELDWALERQGHRFARYADDCNIFVKSKRAGERLMQNVTRYLRDSLRLTVNAQKSAVDVPRNRKFLGFTVTRGDARIKVADKAIEKLKATIRELTRRTRGHRLTDIVQELRTALTGWKAYFGITEVLSPLREIDKWVRRRLRCYAWKQWGSAGYRELKKRGVSVREAWNTSKSAHGPWRLSQTPALNLALPAKLFRQMGLPELAAARAA
ncbi:group II intron reverse transcriptase/maturase [Polaromonas sp. P1-6]|nr:group II intron reverse transcriptase/maturase [Polaromonas sp. P1-6]